VASIVLKWLARTMALALLFFWGAFFVEHVAEWFVKPPDRWPPAWVWIAMIFHLGVLLGLAAMLRWTWIGAAATVVFTAAFFICIGVFVPLALVNLAPLAVFALAWMLRGPSARG
jgi:hypothetical protein